MSTEKQALMPFTNVAFYVFPVSDMTAAREFFENQLGLRVTKQWDNDWVEYDIGSGTLALTMADETHKAGVQGASVGLEVDDFDATIRFLKEHSVTIDSGPWDSPACLGCVIKDPDGNEIIVHKRK